MRKGFTLIELLVVIAIIAILAAILFPVFGKAREKARQTHCTNNQKSFGTAIQLYTQEHEETLPVSATFWGDIRVDKAALKCMTKPSKDNGYVFNNDLSGKGMGAVRSYTVTGTSKITDANDVWLTADGIGTAVPNIALSPSDIEFSRHNGKAILSFLDGHVEMLASLPSPTTGMTSYLPLEGTGSDMMGGGSITLATTGAAFGTSNLKLGAQNLQLSTVAGYGAFGSTSLLSAMPTTAFSLAMWVRVPAVPATGIIYDIAEDNPVTAGVTDYASLLRLSFVASKLTVTARANAADAATTVTETAATAITANTWQHVVVSVDYATKKIEIFVDGVSKGSGTGVWSANRTVGAVTKAAIGNSITTAGAYNGDGIVNAQYDDLRIFSRTFTATDATAVMAITK